MAKLLASFLAAIVCFNLLTGCLGRSIKWSECEVEIPFPCDPSLQNSCVNVCGSSVGGTLLLEAVCRRRGVASDYYCDCIFSCPPKASNHVQEKAKAPVNPPVA